MNNLLKYYTNTCFMGFTYCHKQPTITLTNCVFLTAAKYRIFIFRQPPLMGKKLQRPQPGLIVQPYDVGHIRRFMSAHFEVSALCAHSMSE